VVFDESTAFLHTSSYFDVSAVIRLAFADGLILF